tara:strand:- start:212 stop:811 length:600 start_codon:yes stop_codon:yes gene_type:complete
MSDPAVRSDMAQSEHIQRRHFVVSIMTDENGDEITEKTVERIDERIRHHADVRPVNFMQWQLEITPDTDRLHFHVYIEYETSVRLRTIRKEWSEIGWGQQQVRAGTREQARHYVSPEFYDKEKGLKWDYTHLAGPWSVGCWREDDDSVAGISREGAAYQIIAEGGHPRDVAMSDPQMYGRCFRGLYALYNELRGQSPRC